MMMNVRPSAIAGTWYEASPQRLAAVVDAYLEAAVLPDLDGRVVGVMAPHAGYRYSGAVAGHAFAALRGYQVDVVAVISPMHRPYAAPLLTSGHDAYATPLGAVPIAKDMMRHLDAALRQRLPFGLTTALNDLEHSLEIELPFLQRALDAPFQLAPVMMRAQDAETARALGSALAEILSGQNAVLVASTDLSHYHPQLEAEILDGHMMQAVSAFDPQALYDAALSGQGEACGLGALAAVMWAAQSLGARCARVLRHATSGDATGDYSAVVGYGAAAFLA